jgi:hypothetical protein
METWCERWNIKINGEKTRGIYFSRSRRLPESHLTLNGINIPFVNNVKYLGVIFDSKITWRLHIEMIEAKAFRTFIRAYSLFKSERLSAKIKLTLHKALIRSVREFAADTNLMKLQRLQNRVLRTIGNYPRHTPVRDLHLAFHIPYVYDYITKLCRQQAEVIQTIAMEMFATLDKAKPTTGNKRGLNLAAVKHTTVQVSKTAVVAKATKNRA